MGNRESEEGKLGIVLLIDSTGPLTFDNVHPAHHHRLKKYEAQSIEYELRREERLSELEPLAVAVYRKTSN